MNRATPTQARQAAETVNTFLHYGVWFVPIPVTSEEDFEALQSKLLERLDALEQSAMIKERERGG